MVAHDRIKLSSINDKTNVLLLNEIRTTLENSKRENIEERYKLIHSKSNVSSFCPRCCGVAVIISASHAEGLQFNPGQHQLFNL